jgi:hypothetical protein
MNWNIPEYSHVSNKIAALHYIANPEEKHVNFLAEIIQDRC